eukprot:TRINITY_DN17145_c0_g1_i1.p1 TRINITY_DN17145_c0_g1~~TRINITY_DN17145_c0_g1_i1.p1  ORF type:complete len:272 (+),score=13.82 TRINITY_DN17145_c0_g1_i1:54-818(+)
MTCDFQFLGHTGNQLTPSDKAALRCSLPLLAHEHKADVQFWGKVFGTSGDYLVTQVNKEDMLAPTSSLYSIDGGVQWHLLPTIDDETIELCRLIKGDLRGDPAYGYEIKGFTIKESERLIAFITLCDRHCAVVPRGAFQKGEDGKVRVNPAFMGISIQKAGKLSSYLHRRHLDTEKLSSVHREHLDSSIDCMPSIYADIPQGVWRLAKDDMLGAVFGSNLRFKGSVWYHKPNTPIHGYYYFGDGQENTDLAFML